MNRCCLLSLLLLLCSGASSACGAVIIEVRDTTMSAGTSSFVDVWLTGDPGDTLEEFGYEFSISGVTPQSGDLQFSLVQSDSEVTEAGVPPFDTSPPYVFLDDSEGFNAARTSAVTLTGGDILAADQQDRSVAGTFLLARLELTHEGSLFNPSHDFTISLVPGGSFFDRDADDPGISLLAFTQFSGTVTVTSAAVPEPSSFALLGLAAAVGGYARRRRKIAADDCVS